MESISSLTEFGLGAWRSSPGSCRASALQAGKSTPVRSLTVRVDDVRGRYTAPLYVRSPPHHAPISPLSHTAAALGVPECSVELSVAHGEATLDPTAGRYNGTRTALRFRPPRSPRGFLRILRARDDNRALKRHVAGDVEGVVARYVDPEGTVGANDHTPLALLSRVSASLNRTDGTKMNHLRFELLA
jgi:hypothetical protein